MNGWPTTRACSPVICSAIRRLLRAPHQVVDQHAEPPSLGRAELAHDRGQVVHAVQRLDDDALDAQVVAPDLLDQFGVVLALDVDAAARARPAPGPRPRRSSPTRCASAPSAPCASAAPGRRADRPPRSRGRADSRALLPKRSSRWTTSFSQRTTAPTNPVLGSSTTRSRSASTCGTGFFTVRGWTRLSYGERGGTPHAGHGDGRIRERRAGAIRLRHARGAPAQVARPPARPTPWRRSVVRDRVQAHLHGSSRARLRVTTTVDSE